MTARDVIGGIGMITPVGDDAVSSCAALRAGMSGVVQIEALPLAGSDPEWDPPEPVRGGLVPILPPRVQGLQRLIELGGAAVRDLVTSAGITREEMAESAWLIGLPVVDAVTTGWSLHTFPAALFERLGFAQPALVEMDPSGSVAAVRLLARAHALFDAGSASRAIILCCDSLLSTDRVIALDRNYRLRSTRAPDGFFPGEGAVALLIAREGAATRNWPPLAHVAAVGFGEEPHALASDRAPTGRGASDALRGVLGGGSAAWLLSDMNGESVRAFEWGVVVSRLANQLGALEHYEHPAEHTGDLGAAMAALLIARAARALATNNAPADRAIILAAADSGARAAVALERAG